ncbi:ribosome small subunit-dependent GTPase A [Uliginosibacterium sp. H1]|uniref:ribosome small subunit-dependent GTPase A n=1 Tax=Uliginosibacterium sp. H1 TaxID=3114757 RepID=UPI002E18F5D0|nr:ribosome small subunit-dependent GTPase A [Uliginosibacterium sp. H1]
MSTLRGTVVAAFGRQYEVLGQDGETRLCFPRAKKSVIACGDHVQVAETAPGQGVIEKLIERDSLLYRADAFKEKLIAANVTQVVIVTATAPGFSDELISRCICASESQGLQALILLNKCDLSERLAEARHQLEPFAALAYPVLELSARQGDIAVLRDHLHGHTSLFVGQSGMGKSTLTNALIPDAGADTREISTALDSGKHTTTHARLYQLDADSRLIDSPGLQAFGLAHLAREEIERGFRELRPLLGQCRFRDCWHDNEPGCVVRTAYENGDIHARRFGVLRKLLDEHRALPRY